MRTTAWERSPANGQPPCANCIKTTLHTAPLLLEQSAGVNAVQSATKGKKSGLLPPALGGLREDYDKGGRKKVSGRQLTDIITEAAIKVKSLGRILY